MTVASSDSLNIALNKSECLVSKTNLGYDKITNVCTGRTFDVSWGLGDWTQVIAITILCLILVALLVFIAKLMREDI